MELRRRLESSSSTLSTQITNKPTIIADLDVKYNFFKMSCLPLYRNKQLNDLHEGNKKDKYRYRIQQFGRYRNISPVDQHY